MAHAVRRRTIIAETRFDPKLIWVGFVLYKE